MYKKVIYGAQLGVSLTVPVVLLLLLGLWLDNNYHTMPLFVVTGAVLGFAVSIYNAFKITNLVDKHD